MFPVVNPRLVESVNRIFPFVYHQFFIIFKLSLSLSLSLKKVSRPLVQKISRQERAKERKIKKNG